MARPQRTTSQYLAMCRRMVRAAGRRVAGEDPDMLRELSELRHAVDDALVVAVAGQRAAGITWASIGEAMGTTREAAFLRWADKVKRLEEESP